MILSFPKQKSWHDIHFLDFFGFGRSDSLYSRPKRIASKNAGSPRKAPAISFHQGFFDFGLLTISFKFATSASKTATRSFSFIMVMVGPFLPIDILHFHHTEHLAGHQWVVGIGFSFHETPRDRRQ